jgi:elongation factor Ts
MDLKLITQLREMTGAGLNDCRATLIEAEGNLDKAIELMRKKGEIKAAKKADRVVKEGAIAIAGDHKRCAVVALACETDFVSRGEEYQNTVKEMAEKLLAEGEETFSAWADTRIKDLVLKIGENIQLAGSGIYEGELIGRYLHANKKVAGIIVLAGGEVEAANDVAMQIAAMAPKWLKPEEVEAEVLAKEKEIYQEQLKSEGKPEQIWEKIIDGKLNKFYEENCLVNQVFIKDDSKKIKDLLGDAQIVSWARFQV